jgi:diamine N-acetyltransferase
VRRQPGAHEFTLSYAPGDGEPAPFYRRLGFEDTGEWDEGEKVMRLDLNEA